MVSEFNDIESLKKKILTLAISGKLVPQIESEGTADDLLKEIAAERAELIEAGKLKKEKPLPEITEDEIPFKIPKSWKWVKLREIATCNLGKTKDEGKNTGKFCDYLCSINIYNGAVDLTTLKQMRFEPDEAEKYSVRNGDLLICEGGDVGKCAVWNRKEPMLYQNALHRVRFFGGVNPFFIMNVMHFYKGNHTLEDISTGVTIKHLTNSCLNQLWFPLPPLAEQRRIVDEINAMSSELDILSTQQESLSQNLNSIKTKILSAAVSGKLVPQIEAEGTADDLLKEIAAERAELIKAGKLKKEKPLPEITEDEIPFEIPKNWKWVRLGKIITLISGRDLENDKFNSDNNGIPYLTGASNIDIKGNLIIDRWTINPEVCARDGDVLVSCKGTIGKTTILDIPEVHIARQFMALRSILISNKYLHYFVMYYVNVLKGKARSMIPGIERNHILSVVFPLPPLAEQHRIVAKIDELMKIINQLN